MVDICVLKCYFSFGGDDMGWLKKLLWRISGEGRYLTLEQIHQILFGYDFFTVEKGDWEDGGAFTLLNDRVGVYYLKTKVAENVYTETFDIHALGYRGGALITFVDDQLKALILNGIEQDVSILNKVDRQRLWQMLLKVRQAVVVFEEEKMEKE